MIYIQYALNHVLGCRFLTFLENSTCVLETGPWKVPQVGISLTFLPRRNAWKIHGSLIIVSVCPYGYPHFWWFSWFSWFLDFVSRKFPTASLEVPGRGGKLTALERWPESSGRSLYDDFQLTRRAFTCSFSFNAQRVIRKRGNDDL